MFALIRHRCSLELDTMLEICKDNTRVRIAENLVYREPGQTRYDFLTARRDGLSLGARYYVPLTDQLAFALKEYIVGARDQSLQPLPEKPQQNKEETPKQNKESTKKFQPYAIDDALWCLWSWKNVFD
ncbi:MAG: hypothetical protein HY832_01595, partial [Candidatus Aenigmarchaeota archaeon]|nr:hypothetical protein [Candidatus Aenigmarchaeota archaeon]